MLLAQSNYRDLHSSFIYIGHRTYNFRNEDNAITYGNESTGYYLVLNGIIKPNTMGFRGTLNGELKALSVAVAELMISLPTVTANCFDKGLRLLNVIVVCCFAYECCSAQSASESGDGVGGQRPESWASRKHMHTPLIATSSGCPFDMCPNSTT